MNLRERLALALSYLSIHPHFLHYFQFYFHLYLAALQTLIALASIEREDTAVVFRSNTGSNVNMAKLLTSNKKAGKVLGFLMICRLYIRMRIRDTTVEKQVQWVLLYIQKGTVDIWKNIMEDLESGNLNYTIVREFLSGLKKEFSGKISYIRSTCLKDIFP